MIAELTNHLWQSTLFALGIALLAVAFGRNRAAIRYGLWLSASIKFLVPFSLLVALGNQVEWSSGAAQVTQRTWPLAGPEVAVAVEWIAGPFSAALPPISTDSQPSTDWVPFVALGIWGLGFAAVLWMRSRHLGAIRAALLASTPADTLSTGVDVRVCPGLIEPGVAGFLRPVLLLPAGIVDRLTPSQLRAVLAHEICHIRRRDNLTALTHMVVEAVFWFHPLVWWIGARLVEERERACDEEVLRLGFDPGVYAEGILNVCKFYRESPLACVAGVSGANTRKRVEEIMKNHIGAKLTVGRAVLLSIVAAASVAGPMVVGVVRATPAAAIPTEPTASQTTLPGESSAKGALESAAGALQHVVQEQRAVAYFVRAEAQSGERTRERTSRWLAPVNWQTGIVQLETALRFMGLTEDQQANLERVIEAHRPTVSRTGGQLEAEEAALERLLDAEPVDTNAVFTQLEVVIRARGDLERANTAMLLEFREYITRDQWEQFQRFWGYGQGISLRLRPTEAPAGFGAGRGGRGGPRGAETPQ